MPGAGLSTDPDIQIADFCDKILNFKEQARAVWNGAYRRTFNVWDTRLTMSSECFRSELAPETLQRIAGVGASVMVAIYPRDSGDRSLMKP